MPSWPANNTITNIGTRCVKKFKFSRTDEIFEVWGLLNKSGFPRLPFIWRLALLYHLNELARSATQNGNHPAVIGRNGNGLRRPEH